MAQRGFLVHAVAADASQLTRVRARLNELAPSELVRADRCELAPLPYAPDLANVVIVPDWASASANGLTRDEVARILAPDGLACLGPGKSFRKAAPPRWLHGTHYRDGNGVHPDSAGPFVRLQWLAGPVRPSERYRGVLAYESCGGRNFCVRRAESSAGPKRGMMLSALDASNGLRLWERGVEREFVLATRNRVYAVAEGKLLALSAASGDTVADLGPAGGLRTVLRKDGKLVLVGRGPTRLVHGETTEVLWESKQRSYHGWAAMGDGRIFFSGYAKPVPIVCLDAETGATNWSREGPPRPGAYLCQAGVLVVSTRKGFYAYSAADGTALWEQLDQENSGIEAHHRKCMFFRDGLLWTQNKSGTPWAALDIRTGELRKRLGYPGPVAAKRCSPARATTRYLIDDSNVLLETATGRAFTVPGVRSGCSFGFLPANGMLYSVPSLCTCYPVLRGFLALAPATADGAEPGPRLERGPAWDTRAGVTPRPWRFQAGGRVDGPPTVVEDMVLFGARDGFVYCLRAADGALRWRFRAAPRDRRIIAHGEVESEWPVNGPLLLHDGKVWAVAGRSSELEGGVSVYALEPASGKIASCRELRHVAFHGGIRGNNRIVLAQPPVLTGDCIYVHAWRVDTRTDEEEIRKGHPWPQTEKSTTAQAPAGTSLYHTDAAGDVVRRDAPRQ